VVQQTIQSSNEPYEIGLKPVKPQKHPTRVSTPFLTAEFRPSPAKAA
jgi:hypothetical protein